MTPDAPIQVLYDGACPLCAREANFWRKRDHHHRLLLVDISAPDFDPASLGLSHAAVQSQMHAILPDGRIVTAVAAFRHVYRALGLGWLLAPTDWPVLRPLFDRCYTIFASSIRPRLSRRKCNADGSCYIHHP